MFLLPLYVVSKTPTWPTTSQNVLFTDQYHDNRLHMQVKPSSTIRQGVLQAMVYDTSRTGERMMRNSNMYSECTKAKGYLAERKKRSLIPDLHLILMQKDAGIWK